MVRKSNVHKTFKITEPQSHMYAEYLNQHRYQVKHLLKDYFHLKKTLLSELRVRSKYDWVRFHLAQWANNFHKINRNKKKIHRVYLRIYLFFSIFFPHSKIIVLFLIKEKSLDLCVRWWLFLYLYQQWYCILMFFRRFRNKTIITNTKLQKQKPEIKCFEFNKAMI